MVLAFALAAQLTGYLPASPPRKPITDPMFAASPVRELRRQWDDCVWGMRQLILMNSVTNADRAAKMVEFCADDEDRLTGMLVKRYGLGRATAAMKKARQAAEADLRNFSGQLDGFIKSQPPAPPQITPKPAYTVTTNQTGCGSEYLTGSGPGERALGYFYDKADDNRLDSRGKLVFAFRDQNLAQILSAKRKNMRLGITLRGFGDALTRLDILGQAWLEGDRVVIVTNFGGMLASAMMTDPALQSVILAGPSANAYEFDARKFTQMVGDVQNCARRAGAWEGKP